MKFFFLISFFILITNIVSSRSDLSNDELIRVNNVIKLTTNLLPERSESLSGGAGTVDKIEKCFFTPLYNIKFEEDKTLIGSF